MLSFLLGLGVGTIGTIIFVSIAAGLAVAKGLNW